MNLQNYVLYTPAVEQTFAGEEEVIQQISQAMSNVQHTTAKKNNHALRAVHSKSHGALKGTVTVFENLPEAFSQGVFAKSKEYGAMLRLSTSPADLFADSVGGVRGLALKLLGVDGIRDSNDSADANTQDFLLVNHPTFPAKDSKAFLMEAKLLDKVVSHVPEPVQVVQDKAIRAAADVARSMGMDPVGLSTGLAKANTNILGDTFYTAVPIRYGKYIAKISVSPISNNLQTYVDERIDESDDNALRHAVATFFEKERGEWEIRVQLCTDINAMPVEDASIRWSEDESPYVPVAKLVIEPQKAFSEARNRYSEDVLAFTPWNTVAEHKPLGSIMRARKMAYDMSAKFRHQNAGVTKREPQNISEMPD